MMDCNNGPSEWHFAPNPDKLPTHWLSLFNPETGRIEYYEYVIRMPVKLASIKAKPVARNDQSQPWRDHRGRRRDIHHRKA